MTKGPAGYGRYNDSPEYVGCPRAKSDMTPCIARDGSTALSDGERGMTAVCIGCSITPSVALADLRKELPKKDRSEISCAGNPKAVANRLRELVRKVTGGSDWRDSTKCQNPGCNREEAIPGSHYCCLSCRISAESAGPWDIEPYSAQLDDSSLAFQMHHHRQSCEKKQETQDEL